MRIYPKTIKGHTYYYAQTSQREKLEPGSAHAKTKGSGPSRVRSHMIFLGTAEAIVAAMTKTPRPVEVRHRAFGLVAAAYQTAVEVGLVDILQQHLPGERFGLPRWLYFLLPILNRLSDATSKARMGAWAAGTVLPTLLDFDPARLNSQTFWYVTDDVISEKELTRRRQEQPELDDALFVGLEDPVFRAMEQAVVRQLQERYPVDGNILLYDTTNFFTYIEEPVRARLARTGHNKDAHHHLRQVGLALCVDKTWGLPLFYRLYRGNGQDAKTFAEVWAGLLAALRAGFTQVHDLVLVLDKGNNSQANFAALRDHVQWVGSLTPSHYADLLALPLDAYTGQWENGQGTVLRYYGCQRTVLGADCALVLTYNERLHRKQEHTLQNALDKLTRQLHDQWNAYQRPPRAIPKGMHSLLQASRYRDCLRLDLHEGQLRVTQTDAVQQRRVHFGKNLLFAADRDAEPTWIIAQYHAKDRIEDDFKLLKDPDAIRWRPCRHWTDTKIRAYAFCCVMALLLLRLMERKAADAGLRMSPAVLKQELDDLREITVVQDPHTAHVQISTRSTVQQRLWKLFHLDPVAHALTGHHPES